LHGTQNYLSVIISNPILPIKKGGREGIYMCTYGWFMLLYSRNRHIIVKQLSSNEKWILKNNLKKDWNRKKKIKWREKLNYNSFFLIVHPKFRLSFYPYFSLFVRTAFLKFPCSGFLTQMFFFFSLASLFISLEDKVHKAFSTKPGTSTFSTVDFS